MNDDLEVYGKLNGTEKPLVVSALLLKMQEEGFNVARLEGKSSPTDGEIVCEGLNYPKLEFIKTHPLLNAITPALGHTPLRHFAELLMKSETFDLISEVYGGKYSYSGNDGHDLGIVLTPTHIVELCCELLNLKAGERVLEPCCGTGRFLVNAMKYVGDNVTGVELQEDLYTMSSINVKVSGGATSQVVHGDFFREDLRVYTAGFMNPPYSQEVSELEFTERLLDVLDVGGRAAVLVPVSVMIGKTKKERKLKGELLTCHTLEGVISLNRNTFYGVGTVPCIALFRAGIPHSPDKQAKFVNFEDYGWEVKMHTGLVETERAKDRRQYLLDCWEGLREDYHTEFMVKSQVEAGDEWLHSFYYYNDEPPKEEDFSASLADYLTFEFEMIAHGRGYLFAERQKSTPKSVQCEIAFEE